MAATPSWVAELACPIPARISPHADAVQEWLLDWVVRVAGPLDPEARKRLASSRTARYAGRLYPEATEPDLRVLAALFLWFFLLDDACDGTGTPQPNRVAALCGEALRLLRDEPPPRPGALDERLRRMLTEAWQVPRRRMSAAWRRRFVDAVAHHFDGVTTEATNKATGQPPDVATYVTLRRATSAAYVSYALIEFATGRPVPDAIYHHPAVRAVADTANDLLSWFNDLLSLERDAVTSGGHNLVLAVAREEGIPRDAAVRVVVGRWQESMTRFVELREAVPSFGGGHDEALALYLDGLANSVRGTLDWSLESARYAGLAAAR
ncbi:terpene synthase [Micromonospora sp. HM5-17]|uniref:terpene synthase family protein n=1 Tax=Micromonospora sp. HM5-17 TaxID=2487710 RepID=UPI000F4A1E9A|nr:terpene synthase [Micromonospora sp. HM5-17]ROT33893.1 terpene synthase [Micromonospora sp. HM5-17]